MPSIALFRPRLSRLLLQHFARIADAFLLVRIRLAEAADVGGHLADQLPIHPGHRDVRLLVDRDVESLRDVEHDRMRVAEREDDLLALQLGAVADADDVELLLEAFGDAEDRVGDEAAREPVELAQLRIRRRRLGDEMAVGDREVDAGRMRLAQLALRPLAFARAVVPLHGDALRYRDRFLPNA